jgi:hypothetical protein
VKEQNLTASVVNYDMLGTVAADCHDLKAIRHGLNDEIENRPVSKCI